MFLLNEVLAFAPGRRQEALDRLGWIHGLMASKPGFREAIVAKYLGDGSRHTVLRIWENEDHFQRFREGPDGNYGRGRPPGLYTNDAVVPRWNSVIEVRGGEEGNYLVKVQQTVPEAVWEAFIGHAKRAEETMRRLGGRDGLCVFRAKDRSEALSIARYRDRVEFESLLESGEYAKVLEAAPAGVDALSTQCFEVVSAVGPA